MHRFGRLLTALAGLLFLAVAPALAVSESGTHAWSSDTLTLRDGPGLAYTVTGEIAADLPIKVLRCEELWCAVDGPGGRPVNPSQPGLSFGFTIGGPNGPQISIGVGNQPQPRPPVIQPIPEPVFGEVCFYDRTRYRGTSFCMESGDSIRNLGDWTDRISSVENEDGLQVQVCSESNYRNCRTYTTSASSLGDFDDYIASIRVR